MVAKANSALSSRLQRNLSLYSAGGVFLVSVLVALISVIPLYTKLKNSREKDLQANLSTHIFAVNQSLERKVDIAEQITSRTRAYQLLDRYLQGKASFEELQSSSTKILGDALGRTEFLVGISRFDPNQQLISKVGPVAFTELKDTLKTKGDSPTITGPVSINGSLYILISAPILSDTNEQIGTDIATFELSELEKITKKSGGLGETGDLVLAQENGDGLESFFQLQNGSKELSEGLVTVLKRAIAQEKRGLERRGDQVIAFAPISNTNWVSALSIDEQELYASVNRDLILVGLSVLMVSLSATAGAILLLRPLIKRVTDARELEKEIIAKTQAFENLKHTQLQLVQAEKMSSLGQLVAGIAHEVNNPMNFIYGNLFHLESSVDGLMETVDFLMAQYSTVPPHIEEKLEELDFQYIREDLPSLVGSIKLGSERIRDIIISLKNFSRLDESSLKRVDIHEGIDSTLLLLQNRTKADPIYPKIEIIKRYGSLPKIECYSGQVNQVFMNILSNAIDALEARVDHENATRESSVSSGSNGEDVDGDGAGNGTQNGLFYGSFLPKITITTEMGRDEIAVIKIADNGLGISDHVRQKLFDAFFTTKPVGKGTGLGLSISYQIIHENHHGTLRCQSHLNQGTQFIIHLPLQQTPVSVKGKTQEKARGVV
ncbi:MAG: ATP-binding protein [Cyanobacteria bacterium P01_C01_bin.89]